MLYELEFYNSPTGEVMFTGENVTSPLRSGDRAVVTELLDTIRDCYADAYAALSQLYSKSASNRPYMEFRIVSRFIRCNCGNFDTQRTDYQDGIFALEQVPCPLRGCHECPLEGIVCGPKRTSSLTARQMEVAHLLAEGCNNQEVADRLTISINTVHVLIAQIKSRLGVKHTRQIINFINNL